MTPVARASRSPGRGTPLPRLHAEVARAGRAVSGGPRSLRDVPGRGVRVYQRDALPRFIEEEFRGLLRCGFLAGGFARFHCGRCGLDRLVPFSCKGRAICPSCGGRRMAERAAHLVDHVFPMVPVRQWVLTLPHGLRYVLAWDHTLCRAVSGVFVRVVLGFLRRRARRAGAHGGGSWSDHTPASWAEPACNLAPFRRHPGCLVGSSSAAHPRRGRGWEMPSGTSSGLWSLVCRSLWPSAPTSDKGPETKDQRRRTAAQKWRPRGDADSVTRDFLRGYAHHASGLGLMARSGDWGAKRPRGAVQFGTW